MEQTIIKWIGHLINKEQEPKEIIDNKFHLEDGMNYIEYLNYEKNSFDSYSNIFDLDKNFKIRIIHVEKIREDANLVWFYVLNKKDKVAFKMSMTINHEKKISSNNFNTQIVSKYKIENDKIKSLGLAIKSRREIENIISPDLDCVSFEEGANFKEDGFYSAEFVNNKIKFNNKYRFFIKFKNEKSIEKRSIFFDNLRIEDKPYNISNNELVILNDKYPVNINIEKTNGDTLNIIYPRDFKTNIEQIKKAIITDVLDNDWEINLN